MIINPTRLDFLINYSLLQLQSPIAQNVIIFRSQLFIISKYFYNRHWTKPTIASFIQPALTSAGFEDDILAGDAGLFMGIHTEPVLSSSYQPSQLNGGFMLEQHTFHRPITLGGDVRQIVCESRTQQPAKSHDWKQPSLPWDGRCCGCIETRRWKSVLILCVN